MAQDTKTVRRREGQPSRPPVVAPPEPVVVAPVSAAPSTRTPPKAARPVVSEARVAFDRSDLEALASMDMEELARLMDGSASRNTIKPGGRVTGTVTRVGSEHIYLDIGGKSEGMLERENHPNVRVGDSITAYILDIDEDGVHMSARLSGNAAGAFILEAASTGVPVEGKVVSRNAGGFDVRIGTVRAFCPVSLIDRHPDADLDTYVGQTYEFKVIEADEKTVVSRRALLDAGIVEKRGAFWETAKIGDVHSAVITSIQTFGVFVDANGIDGLVPKRELSWDDNIDLSGFQKGQALQVRIVDLDHDKRKVTFSSKDQSLSPWVKVGTDFVEGNVYEGSVARTAEYGVFVELAPGLQGLLHYSRAGGLRPKVGESLRVRLQLIDRDRQRLELAAEDAGPAQAAPKAAGGEIVKGVVQQVLKNGLLVDLEGGVTGWVPAKEIDLPGNTNIAQRFRAGKTVDARVIDHDPSRRRSTLSLRLKAADDDSSWRGQQGGTSGGSLGTFADLLSGMKLKK